jgi:phosphoesterase RecJ-like protein
MKKLVEEIRQKNDFVVTSHVDPDGDAVGSQLAMASLLKEIGKRVVILSEKAVPRKYQFLPSVREVVTELPAAFECQAAVVLDCASIKRLGKIAPYLDGKFLINIDHHPTNMYFGNVNWVVPGASSTSELIYRVIEEMGVTVGEERATCLYVGILTDTGGFRFPNTTSDSLRIASALVEQGADPSIIATQVYLNRSMDEVLLLSKVLATVEVHSGIGTMCLTRSMVKDMKVNTEGFSDHVLQLKNVEVGALFKELDGRVKVSLRSRGEIDVSMLAREFGGGGHETAAACLVTGKLSEVKRKILEAGKRLYGRNHSDQ